MKYLSDKVIKMHPFHRDLFVFMGYSELIIKSNSIINYTMICNVQTIELTLCILTIQSYYYKTLH